MPVMSNGADSTFVETRQYERFREFCDSCRRYRYIGLCYGPPGVGKTLSARHYANWDTIESFDPFSPACAVAVKEIAGSDAVLYTPKVANSPGQIENEIRHWRDMLRHLSLIGIEEAMEPVREDALQREQQERVEWFISRGWLHQDFKDFPRSQPTVEQVAMEYARKRREAKDPTRLIVIDEADRLKMAGLEQARDIFDRGGIGMVLIGMPGLEKRLARYPQLYSRIGFVHEFRPLTHAEVRHLLHQRWRPQDVSLPEDGLADEESVAAIIRITGGNFRLLHRLLAQIGRMLEINRVTSITPPVIEAARLSLVIGTA